MPSAEEIQQYLTGAWRMMMGKPDGLRLLDLSADGFWNSFFAIIVALPALFVGWVGVANDVQRSCRRHSAAGCLDPAAPRRDRSRRLGRCRWWLSLPVAPGRASATVSSAMSWPAIGASALFVWLMLPARCWAHFARPPPDESVAALAVALRCCRWCCPGG